VVQFVVVLIRSDAGPTMLPYPVIRQHGAHFSIFPISLWRALRGPAVYILGHDPGDFVVAPIYVGETEQLRDYMGPGHHKWREALARGMNVICVHPEHRGPQFRRNLETILRRRYRPALNDQGIPPVAASSAALVTALMESGPAVPVLHPNALAEALAR
jgi:hypothetical protein